MGASVSTTKIQNKLKDNLSFEDRQDIQNRCIVTQSASNLMDFSGAENVDISGTIDMMNSIKSNCEFKVLFDKLSKKEQYSDVLNNLLKNQESSSIFSLSKQNTQIHTFMERNINMKELVNIVNECVQNVNVENTIKGINAGTVNISGDIKMRNNVFNECIYDTYMKKIDELGLRSKFQEEVKETQKILGLFDMKSLAILGVAIVLVIIILILFKKK